MSMKKPKKTKKLTVIKLNISLPENEPEDPSFNRLLDSNSLYVILGEVKKAKGHYILMDLAKGALLPGFFELWRFEKASGGDL